MQMPFCAIMRSWTLLAAFGGAYAPGNIDMHAHVLCMRNIDMHVHVLCCFALFVCLTLLASFFLPSHLSFKNMYVQVHVQ